MPDGDVVIGVGEPLGQRIQVWQPSLHLLQRMVFLHDGQHLRHRLRIGHRGRGRGRCSRGRRGGGGGRCSRERRRGGGGRCSRERRRGGGGGCSRERARGGGCRCSRGRRRGGGGGRYGRRWRRRGVGVGHDELWGLRRFA